MALSSAPGVAAAEWAWLLGEVGWETDGDRSWVHPDGTQSSEASTRSDNTGTRGTGNGMREAGQAALDSFTEWKSVYVDFSGRLQRAQIDTDAVLSSEMP